MMAENAREEAGNSRAGRRTHTDRNHEKTAKYKNTGNSKGVRIPCLKETPATE